MDLLPASMVIAILVGCLGCGGSPNSEPLNNKHPSRDGHKNQNRVNTKLAAPNEHQPIRIKQMGEWILLETVSQDARTRSILHNSTYPVERLKRTRRYFTLPKREFLLGEPILVRYSHELDGPGSWRKNLAGSIFYRANRYVGFIILVMSERGKWLADRYRPPSDEFPAIISGGTGFAEPEEFNSDKPEIHWIPVQQHSRLATPGNYELHCIAIGDGGYQANTEAPLAGIVPEPLVAELRRRGHSTSIVGDYAKFSLSIVKGTEPERQQMIAASRKLLVRDMRWNSPHRSRPKAMIRAWEYSTRNDFLPWIGIAYRNHPEKDKVVYRHLFAKASRWTCYPISRAEAAEIVPKLIDDLTHQQAMRRSTAELQLREWSGTSFEHSWGHHHPDRPTLAEGTRMQPMWRRWWQQSGNEFSSKTRQPR